MKLPTAVFGAPAPSFAMTSVAVAPEVETAASEPPLGTFVSVQGAVSEEGSTVSREGGETGRPCRCRRCRASRACAATSTGRAPSVGEVAAKAGEVAAGVADAGRARGERDGEGADGGVGCACAFGDRERGDRRRDGETEVCRRSRARSRASRERCPRCSTRPAIPRRWRVTRSTLPLVLSSCMTRVTRTGVAPGRSVRSRRRRTWLPAASWIPVALAASTTVKLPTAVFGAPAPSFECRASRSRPRSRHSPSVPPLGTFVSVQGAVSEDGSTVSLEGERAPGRPSRSRRCPASRSAATSTGRGTVRR